MDTMLQDIRYAIRMLRKAPGATAVAVLSLAVGISVNTTVFSWVRSVLLNPLPGVAEPGRMVTLETVTPSGELIDSSYPDFRDYRDRSRELAGVIAFKERPLGLGEDTRSERVWALMVSGNYFDVLGVRPELGRFFTGVEQGDTFGAAPVAILSHGLWKSRFNGDPQVIGRTIRLNRHELTIIGVAPDGFYGTISGLRFDVYVPLTMQASLTGGGEWLDSRGLAPAVPLRATEARRHAGAGAVRGAEHRRVDRRRARGLEPGHLGDAAPDERGAPRHPDRASAPS